MDKVIITWDLKDFTSKRIIPVFESLSGLIVLEPLMHLNYLEGKISEKDNIVFVIGNNRKYIYIYIF